MVHRHRLLSVLTIAFVIVFALSCNKLGDFFDFDHLPDNTGYVYTMSNESGTNKILVYKQEPNGRLAYKATINSGGSGSGMALGTQGSMALDKLHQQLYAVNAGSNSISSFKVNKSGMLTLSQTISSEGAMPVSLTLHAGLLYVVNDGGNICGFKIAGNGQLSKIDGSLQPLSSPTADPAEILFKPDGSILVVTEKATNSIVTYEVDGSGRAETPAVHSAEAQTPFGFVFHGRDHAIITNAFGGAPDASRITSFGIRNDGMADLISNIPDHEAAACWIALAKEQDFGFITNTGSNTISSVRIASDGSLTLVDSVAISTGGAPADIILSGNGKFAYNINGMSHSIGQYKILPHGRLQSLGDLPGLPMVAAGIVAF